jgi:GH15 family glucan-1,4-alpha-glucosidase
MRTEDYGVIGDLHTIALVGADGSIDWLCLPHFGAEACFAALVGDPGNGHWRIAPRGPVLAQRRQYRGDTLILETEFTTAEGVARLVDFMPVDGARRDVVRLIEGVSGRVDFACQLVIRFDYGQTVPWVRRLDTGGLTAVAGANALTLRTEFPLEGRDLATEGVFPVVAGERQTFVLSWHPSQVAPPPALDAAAVLQTTSAFWQDWAARCTYRGAWGAAVRRSLLTLKALTYRPTGGIVAAATTSLPEFIGGVRNWDYRFCWLRDATFTLYAFMAAGYADEARAWSEWLLRAVAGDPAQMQTMYGVAGERTLTERELPHLRGFEDSRPVRVGNAASEQFQLDIYGEVLDALHVGRTHGLPSDPSSWALQRHLIAFVSAHWREPDQGIWEIRGPRRHFTHSKVLAWVAMDRAVRAVAEFGLDGDARAWAATRDEIHAEVCAQAYHPGRQAFTQSYGATELDASVLMMPLVGFLPPDDPRIVATVARIEEELTQDGLVLRYQTDPQGRVDGLPAGEGVFLPCSFWLTDCLHLMGRTDEARARFEKLLTLCNPLGLLAEEYDPGARRQLGNFPQAFSHVGLVNTAQNLSLATAGPATERSAG